MTTVNYDGVYFHGNGVLNAYDMCGQHFSKMVDSKTTSWGDRLIHLGLGVLEAIPVVNAVVAYIEKCFHLSSIYDSLKNTLSETEVPVFTGTIDPNGSNQTMVLGNVTAPIMQGEGRYGKYFLVNLPHSTATAQKIGIYSKNGWIAHTSFTPSQWCGSSSRSPIGKDFDFSEDFGMFDKSSHAGLRKTVRAYRDNPIANFTPFTSTGATK